MVTDKLNKEKIKMICRNLQNESINKIDFDELIEILGVVQDNINCELDAEKELEYLKDEYRNRIVGMVKANLACRENQMDTDLAVQLSDDISGISAEEMVGMYSRVAARFRANFPTSFRYLTFPTQTTNRKNWNEHKI